MKNFFLIIVLLVVCISCTKKEEIRESLIKEKSLDLQVLEAYQEGVKSLKSGDVLYAAKSTSPFFNSFNPSLYASII